jgi:hypothetical protein
MLMAKIYTYNLMLIFFAKASAKFTDYGYYLWLRFNVIIYYEVLKL